MKDVPYNQTIMEPQFEMQNEDSLLVGILIMNLVIGGIFQIIRYALILHYLLNGLQILCSSDVCRVIKFPNGKFFGRA